MITLQDLIDRFGETELAERTDHQHYTTIDETVINKAIFDATADVESYLNATGLFSRNRQGRLVYSHAATAPKALVIKICDLTRFYLYDDIMPSIVEKRYNQAIDWLKMVAKNPAMLTGEKDINANLGVNSGIVVIPNQKPDMWKI